MQEFLSGGLSTFVLIALAEVGDKSQLVCMALASRYRQWPVLLGAASAFMLLNVLAVLFGASVGLWVHEQVMAMLVGLLFAVFGILALRSDFDSEAPTVRELSGRGIFATTFLLITASEFGDKTQIAVAGLAGGLPAVSVWVGATGALLSVSALGVWAGRTLLQRLPLGWLHRLGGGVFLVFSAIAFWRAIALL